MKQEKLQKFGVWGLVLSALLVLGIQKMRIGENNVRYEQCKKVLKEYSHHFCSEEGVTQTPSSDVDAVVIRLGQKNTLPEMYLIKKEIEKFPPLEDPLWTGLNHRCNFDFTLLVDGNKCQFVNRDF